ncbi:Uma2 family endonuclease [Nostoc sp. B(2019)]|nr:Uma2 family endonuclease [Nostoc sp. B(2019)]
MSTTISEPIVTWEKLPDDFPLANEPVDNINQPATAAALTESLELAGLIAPQTLIGTNFGICATVDGKLVIKAPDWFYVPSVLPTVPPNQNRRSYTPKLEGEVPAIVMEFLSQTEGGEYSIKAKYPPGKWYYYERILQVSTYIIFEPEAGWMEVYQLSASGQYQLQQPNEHGRYWIASIGLFLGIWQGVKANRSGYWLRWWDEAGQLLLWGTERLQQEQQLRSRMAAKLLELGIDPDTI